MGGAFGYASMCCTIQISCSVPFGLDAALAYPRYHRLIALLCWCAAVSLRAPPDRWPMAQQSTNVINCQSTLTGSKC